MVGGTGGNQFRQYVGKNVGNQNRYNAVQNVGNQVVHNAVQNPGIQNVGNQNGLMVVPGIANQNQNGNGNVVAARAEGNANGNNAEEYDLMAAAADLDEIEEVNANCILMANLQQASTSGTQTEKAPVYDSDKSAELHNYDNCYDNEIFNMFTQEEQYTELLEPIPEPHQVQQNDSNVISAVSSVEQSGETVEQNHATIEETRVLYWSSTAHQEIHKILKDEIFPIVNQVDARLQNYEIQFLKEVANFVRDFKSLANEVDESLDKQKTLELEIECLLRAVVCHEIMPIVQSNSVVDTSTLQTELERMKE
ncbi:hypothetical protein Tco_1208637 [Tanacetum coccineum]